MILTALRYGLRYVRANLLAQALIEKWDELDPRARAAIADKAGAENIDNMARFVVANVRHIDPDLVAELKKQVRPFDAQCKKWDHTRRKLQPIAVPDVEPADLGDVSRL